MAIAVLSSALSTGCGELQYRTATTHNEVVDITEKQVHGEQRVTVKQDGRLVHVFVKRMCDLVEDKEMARVSVKQSDENVVLEAILMGLATAPLTTGAIVLADSQNVHDNDVNGRLYNETGQSGAQLAGALSLVLGTGMMVGGMVSLIRRTKPEIEETIYHEDGAVLAHGEPCEGQLRQTTVAVTGLLDNGQQVPLGTTNVHGQLTVDLARAVPARLFASVDPPLSLQVHVGSDSYELVDLAPVQAHHQRRRENIWRNAESARCDEERTPQACAGVQQFVHMFPSGRYADEARALLANIGKPREASGAGAGRTKVMAASTCYGQCLVKCEQDQACAADCTREVCP